MTLCLLVIMRRLKVLCKVNNWKPSGSLIHQTLALLSQRAVCESACSCEACCTLPASVALIDNLCLSATFN